MHLKESHFDLIHFEQVVNFYLCFIAGSYLLHPGAQGRGTSETLSEYGRGPEGSSALYPETHGESASSYSVHTV